MKNVLEIKNLKYNDILKDITFSLPKKTFSILIGANGSGKTTIVNCIRCNLKYQGEITILDDTNFSKSNDHVYKHIGFFLEDDLFLETDILTELIQILKNLNYTEEEAQKKIFKLVKKLDIVDILYKTKYELKPYEETLLKFIISIIHEPQIIIIDNDLETLDNKYKNKIFQYLKSLKEITVLLITNNSEYFYMADLYFILEEGKIKKIKSIEDLVKHEKQIIKSGSKLPFNIDVSNKLISYELLDDIEYNLEEMVDKIWK